MTKKLTDVFAEVDWVALRTQKSVLLKAANGKKLSEKDREALDGLVNLLDHFQDTAAEKLGEFKVFGDLDINE